MSVDADSATASLGIDVGADDADDAKVVFGVETGDAVTGNAGTRTLTSDGNDLEYRVNADGSVDAGYYDGGTFVEVFTLTGDAQDGTYTVDIVGTIDPTVDSETKYFDVSTLNASSGNFPGSLELLSDDGSTTLLLQPGGSGDSVNISNQGIGINDQFIEDSEGESLTISAYLTDDPNQTQLEFSDITIDTDHLGTDETLEWTTAGDDVSSGSVSGVGSGSGDNADESIKIDVANDITTVTENNSDDPVITDSYESGADHATFTSIKLEGDGYRIEGGSQIAVTYETEIDVTLDLDATIIDSDGDESEVQDFDVTFVSDDTLTGSEGSDVIVGSDADETIDGGAGNDNIDGGAGDDSLTGGEGADTFVDVEVGDTVEDFDPLIDNFDPDVP